MPFIAFEGTEGAGKSTQIGRLAAELTNRGYQVVVTREPGGTTIGEAIRQVLLSGSHDAMLPEAEALLNTAARAQHVSEVIQPALRAGKVVLTDRFSGSTLAYQGYGRGLDQADLVALQRFAFGDLRPDLTLLLDVPVDVGQARRRASEKALDRLDAASVDFHLRVRDGFLQLARQDPQGWRIIRADRPAADVSREVLAAVEAVLTLVARER
ncbi:MAG TPA: dTMP kinase [Thermomicrobiaceae bacterium]|nr:dTMP kinase [Thermomicrobiaceae bacterium]